LRPWIAEAAFAILESRPGIGLLFTDIQMPAKWKDCSSHMRCIALAGDQDHPGVRATEVVRSDIPPRSRFFGKPLKADEMIAEMQNMIGHA